MSTNRTPTPTRGPVSDGTRAARRRRARPWRWRTPRAGPPAATSSTHHVVDRRGSARWRRGRAGSPGARGACDHDPRPPIVARRPDSDGQPSAAAGSLPSAACGRGRLRRPGRRAPRAAVSPSSADRLRSAGRAARRGALRRSGGTGWRTTSARPAPVRPPLRRDRDDVAVDVHGLDVAGGEQPPGQLVDGRCRAARTAARCTARGPCPDRGRLVSRRRTAGLLDGFSRTVIGWPMVAAGYLLPGDAGEPARRPHGQPRQPRIDTAASTRCTATNAAPWSAGGDAAPTAPTHTADGPARQQRARARSQPVARAATARPGHQRRRGP